MARVNTLRKMQKLAVLRLTLCLPRRCPHCSKAVLDAGVRAELLYGGIHTLELRGQGMIQTFLKSSRFLSLSIFPICVGKALFVSNRFVVTAVPLR